MKERNRNEFHESKGLYIWRNMTHWTPKVTLEGSTYLIEERNGSKRPNLDVAYDGDVDDDNAKFSSDRLSLDIHQALVTSMVCTVCVI